MPHSNLSAEVANSTPSAQMEQQQRRRLKVVILREHCAAEFLTGGYRPS